MSERITFCDSLQYRCAWSTEGGSMSGSFWKRCFSAPPNKMRILLEKSLLIFCFVWYLWLFWVPASNGWKNCLERMTFQLYSGRFCRKAESSERCSGVSVYDKKRSKLKIIENLRLPKKSRILWYTVDRSFESCSVRQAYYVMRVPTRLYWLLVRPKTQM